MEAHGQGGQALHVGAVDQLLATDHMRLEEKEASGKAWAWPIFLLHYTTVNVMNKVLPLRLAARPSHHLEPHCTFSYAYCSCSMMGSLSRKALMQGAMLRPTMPCFFRAVRQVESTWLDAMKSLEQLTTSTSWRGQRVKQLEKDSKSHQSEHEGVMKEKIPIFYGKCILHHPRPRTTFHPEGKLLKQQQNLGQQTEQMDGMLK